MLLAGCTDASAVLFVDARTDLTPGREFDVVVTELLAADGEPIERVIHAVDPAASYVAGARVARLEARGLTRIAVRAEHEGELVVERRAIVEVTASRGVTLLLTRDCRGVECVDPARPSCLAAQCVPETCTVETPETCPEECGAPSDCSMPPSSCGTSSCIAGICLDLLEDPACEPGSRCDAALGCIPTDPAPRPVTSLNGPSRDHDPALTADLLEVFFTSDRAGGPDIWTAVRLAVDAEFSPPARVTELSSDQPEATPRVSADGLSIWFARGPAMNLDIWSSSRPGRDRPWSAPARIARLSSPEDDGSPAVDDSGLTLVLASLRDGSDADLYLSERSDVDAEWSVPERIAELDTGADEASAWPLARGEVLYFASSRGAGPGGARDIYRTTRAGRGAPFADPVPVTEVNGATSDTDPWVSGDERVLFFARGALPGGEDIYWFAR